MDLVPERISLLAAPSAIIVVSDNRPTACMLSFCTAQTTSVVSGRGVQPRRHVAHLVCPARRFPREIKPRRWLKVRPGSTSKLVVADSQQTTEQAQELGQPEVERRLAKAVGLIQTAEELAPYDRVGFSAALVIWQAIQDIPPAQRKKLLDNLGPSDIRRLWQLAGQRYQASKQQTGLTVGSYTIMDEMPTETGQVALFDGKADALFAGLFRFQKAFFLHPETKDLYGRVQLQKGPLGNALYPLYYTCSMEPAIVPATEELTDMQLEYKSPADLHLAPEQVPHNWPQPKEPVYPFNGGLTDYCRMVAPGVLVGVGWKAARPGKDIGRRFLHFVLVRKYD